MGLWQDYMTPNRERILLNGAVFGLLAGIASVASALSQAQPLGWTQILTAGFSAALTAAIIYWQAQKEQLVVGSKSPGSKAPRQKRLGI